MRLTQEQIAEKNAELKQYIDAHKNADGPLMPILQKAQTLFGYLSYETMDIISKEMDVPVSEIFGIATFYAQFSLQPVGDNVVSVCTGTACYVKGAASVLDAVKQELGIGTGETTEDGRFTIRDTRCLGCCGLAPVMMINDDVYGKMTPDAVKGILAKYRS
ncbi:MAG: NADH-quinone oxidoreductase subunit NuoE [Clostridia bacterium]|nr:NADH-quinone oxidoreductase subunit NuoE [Clostridia bacterium]